MTKSLRKAIMRRTKLESKYLKKRTIENETTYKKQKNYCKRLCKKERKNFYSNWELSQITDNKLFWKTIKPFVSHKSIQSSTITLVNKENNQIISDSLELAETFNNYFESAVANLGVEEYENNVTNNTHSDPKDGADLNFERYKDHPSIKMINENVFFE